MKFRVEFKDKDGTESQVREVTISSIHATVTSLRGAAVLRFRLRNPSQFTLVYSGPKQGIDLSDERLFLRDTALEDDDCILLQPKAESAAGTAATAAPSASSTTAASSSTGGGLASSDHGATKTLRTEQPPATSSAAVAAAAAAVEQALPSVTISSPLHPSVAVVGGEDEEANPAAIAAAAAAEDPLHPLEEGDGDDEEEDEMPHDAPDDLYDRLIETVDDLVDMRQRFLADPEGIMRHIQDKDPTLYQLIAANMEEFLALVNDEELVKVLQSEKDGDAGDEEFPDELLEGMGEEEQQALQQMMEEYVQRALGGGGVAEEGEEEDEMMVDGGFGPLGGGLEPTEEEEEKIQNLVQLGFTYEQCKQAFYACHRSVERAANLLFESPPNA